MEKIHKNIRVFMLSCIKYACFHVFSPFSAYFFPHDIIAEKGLLTQAYLGLQFGEDVPPSLYHHRRLPGHHDGQPAILWHAHLYLTAGPFLDVPNDLGLSGLAAEGGMVFELETSFLQRNVEDLGRV